MRKFEVILLVLASSVICRWSDQSQVRHSPTILSVEEKVKLLPSFILLWITTGTGANPDHRGHASEKWSNLRCSSAWLPATHQIRLDLADDFSLNQQSGSQSLRVRTAGNQSSNLSRLDRAHSLFQTSLYWSHEYLTGVMNIERCLKARHLSGNLKITSSIFSLVCSPLPVLCILTASV